MGTANDTKTHNIDDLPVPYLKCRVFGHKWDEYIATGMRKPEFGFRLSAICVCCGTERHDLLNTYGDVEHRGYVYAPGYQVSFSATRAEYRVALNHRRRRRARRGQLTIEVNA